MNNQTISVFEDRQIKLNLNNEQVQDILSLKDIWDSQNLTLQADGTLLMKKYVGFVARNRTHIQILPKIYEKQQNKANTENEIQESIELLFRLLQYTGFLNIKRIPTPQHISNYKNDLLEIFISLFVSEFINLFSQSIYRQYELLEENMQFIKGKILFQQSLIKNSFKKHLHYVEYEEFTANTLLNQIFKTVMLRLLTQTKSSENKKNIKLALVYLEEVDTIRLSKTIFKNVKFNRLNRIYEPLFNMAKLFYSNLNPGYSEGNEYTFTFLIPLNKLFEYYIYKLIDEAVSIQKNQYKVNYQKPQGYLATCINKGVFNLEPDITITEGKEIKYILDAKYKNVDIISQNDVYQVLSYAIHFNCQNLFLVYPIFKDDLDNKDEINLYYIHTAIGDISLKIIQVDIFDNDILKIQRKLLKQVLCHKDVLV